MEQGGVQTNYNDVGTIIMERIYGQDYLSPGALEASVALAAFGGIGAGQRVLDMGSGLGGSACVLAKEYACRVQGIDLMPQNVAEATRRAARKGLAARVDFVVGDATAVPFADADFDVIWGQDAWCHVDEKVRLVNEIARLVKPGGKVVFGDWVLASTDAQQCEQLREVTASPGMARLGEYPEWLRASGFAAIEERDNTALMVERYRECMGRLQSMEAQLRSEFGDRVFDIVFSKQSSVMTAFANGDLNAVAYCALRTQ